MTNKIILENIAAHDAIYKKYEANHGEIYNEVEQKRLKEALTEAVAEVKTESQEKIALDFGCGAGNLTQYLLGLDLTVASADVSVNFLKLVEHKYKKENTRLKFLRLNGVDLSNVEDSSFDFIALYSVLHHLPDYLSILKEFSRVLKPGGVLYIDHEASPNVWGQDEKYIKYKSLLDREIFRRTKFERLQHLFMPSYWVNAFKERMNPRYKPEGDIHVFQDDHIEWERVDTALLQSGMEVVYKKDYLLYTKYCPRELFNQYKDTCDDIRLVVARKK